MYNNASYSQGTSALLWLKTFFVLNVGIGAIIVIFSVIEGSSLSVVSSLMLLGMFNLLWAGFVLSIVMIQKSRQTEFPENFVLVMVPTNITFICVWLYVLLPNFFYTSYYNKLPTVFLILIQIVYTLGAFVLPCVWVLGTLYFLCRILGEICKAFFRGLFIIIYTGSVVYAVTLFSDYLRAQQTMFLSGIWLIAVLYGMIFGGATIIAYLTKQRLPSHWMKMSRKNFMILVTLVGFTSLYLSSCFVAPLIFPQLQASTAFYEQVRFAEMIAAGVECLLFSVMIIEGCCFRRSNHHENYEDGNYNYQYVEEQIHPIQFVIANPPISLQNHHNVNHDPPISIQFQQNSQNPRYPPSSQQNERNITSQTKNENREFNFDTSCCICLDDYKNGEKLMGLKCGHIIHKNCAEELKKTRKTCPLCRAEVF